MYDAPDCWPTIDRHFSQTPRGSKPKLTKAERLHAQGRMTHNEGKAYLTQCRLRLDSNDPRARAALDLLVETYPGFAWGYREVKGGPLVQKADDSVLTHEPNGRPILFITGCPRVGGTHLSLADLVHNADRLSNGEPPLFPIRYFTYMEERALQPLLELGHQGIAFALLLEGGVRWNRPSQPPLISALASWLKRALDGAPSTIVSVVCPDYTVDPATRRYTFDGLHDGIGLVATRVLEVLPAIAQYTKRYKLHVNFVVAIADFEASEATCARVGVTREEFIARLRRSQVAFAEAFAHACPDALLETPLVSEIASGIGTTWEDMYRTCAEAYAAGNKTGQLKLSDADLRTILDASDSLYKRWHGAGVNVAQVLAAQAPEYGAIGWLVRHAYSNALLLGGDRPAMSIFDQQMLGTEFLPVVYRRPVNY